MGKNYMPYHLHTEYSLLDSCDSPENYVEMAVKNGMTALSFSEHGKPLNWTYKKALCEEAGLKYIHSVEIYLTETLEERVRDNYHTVLLAKNEEGVRELNSLISLSCEKDHFYYVNRISFEEFLAMSDNIISTSACLASPLNKLSEDHPMYLACAKKYDFFEIQAHKSQEQVEFNKKLLKLSKKLGTPLIAGTDTHSSSPYKSECRAVLLSAKNKVYGDEDQFDLSFKTYDELVQAFREQGALPESVFLEAIENTNRMADMVECFEVDKSIKYPILYGSREADAEEFLKLLRSKFKEKINSGVIPPEQVEKFKTALAEEVRVFKKLRMEGFMLSMSELVTWCRNKGFIIGPGRGSVGGSRAAYVLDITDINPEKWGTVFSRFCNEDREEIGDIDIDCVDSERPEIFKHIMERFGHKYATRVSSFGTVKDKGTIDDIGRHLAKVWNEKHEKNKNKNNPWSLGNIEKIKTVFGQDPEKTREKYPELFYYFDGIEGTVVSQSVHPAGIVISPITLQDNYGTFDKEGEPCLVLDMDNIHEYTGLAKYDFLILKTLQVLKDTCRYAGVKLPLSHEVDWNDQEVWNSMSLSPVGLFQFESVFAFKFLLQFKPTDITELSMVTAALRPSGASYRKKLLDRIPNKNPSELIDNLLKNNYGYLIYQEDTIRFLQEVCGLSGSEADNVRRAIGRKQRDRLEAALPAIIEGYCEKSPKPRAEAEDEVKVFLQILEDSADYQFNYNHSIAYCMLTYMCAYYRHYYPIQFTTAFLNNAANDGDIRGGTSLAGKFGIQITMPKWGISRGEYSYDIDRKIIAKGLTSVKHMGHSTAKDLLQISKERKHRYFVEVLQDIEEKTMVNSRQIEILIKLEFFSDFGNQRELATIYDLFVNTYRKGAAKEISKKKVEDSPVKSIIERFSTGLTKAQGVAKNYTVIDMESILKESEKLVKASGIEDIGEPEKAKSFADSMGYVGYTSGREEDRRKLYVLEVYPLVRKKDGVRFGYSVVTKSIGSGKEGRFTVVNALFDKNPIKKGDLIECRSFTRNGRFFRMTSYDKIE